MMRKRDSYLEDSEWITMDAADTLFRMAKQRVFSPKRNPVKKSSPDPKKTKVETHAPPIELKGEDTSVKFNEEAPDFSAVLEENPKWALLAEVLEEIKKLCHESKTKAKIIIKVKDERSVKQLREYLKMGPKEMLSNLFQDFLISQETKEKEKKLTTDNPVSLKEVGRASNLPKTPKTTKGQRRMRRLSAPPNYGDLLRMFDSSQHVKKVEEKTKNQKTVINLEPENKAEEKSEEEMLEESKETEYNFYVGGNKRILEQLKPTFIIMYDADIYFFRKIEVFKRENVGVPLRVYWLWYDESIEERKYLTSIDKEQLSFEKLIQEKANMVVPVEQDGKMEISLPSEILPQSNRKGGQLAPSKPLKGRKILVDSREFRSALPSILFSKDFEIIPQTLDVGDYILTPEICVERKSIPDLYGSFASGRLFNQATQLCRHFKKPILLIEFHQDKAFSFQEELNDRINHTSIYSKLVLLTIHFPNLKILWSRSPYATAEMFEDLKSGQSDPDSSQVNVILGADQLVDSSEDILRLLPGITSYNASSVMTQITSLSELSKTPLSKLIQIMGKEKATQLYQFLNHKGREDFGT
eukprot:TRINITY_DN1030_c0_g1_i3.p1 TRINITY_DN1030_c0_g1~~TRINITY_DN1030_c0_g1_i3.p1  ORF type:complete len:584 (+),score=133.47 TRINITY_DN1030_c0_g1_i3:1189-2940(+)